PSPVSSCHANCPPNAFMVVGAAPGFVHQLIVPLRDIAAVVLLAAVIAVLAARLQRGTALMRITLVPVLTAAIVHVLALIGAIVARRSAPDASVTNQLMTITAVSY